MKAPEPRYEGSRVRWNPPDREWLEYHYTTLSKSTIVIAAEISASHTTVSKWLRLHRIPKQTHPKANRSLFWRGGSQSHTSRLARQTLREAGVSEICSFCSSERFVVAHHKDGNKNNNNLSNLQWVCRSCHSVIHELEENLW